VSIFYLFSQYFFKVKNVLIIPKSYNQDKVAQYQGSKGNNATFDVDNTVWVVLLEETP
jgi:hypothetical protein